MGKPRNLTGKRFGRLIALEIVGSRNGRRRWLCKCDCGNTTEVTTYSLTSGETKSCGCLKKSAVKPRPRTKRYDHRELYTIWQGMKQRCNDPNYHSFSQYGGRGIKLCDEWNNSFDSFAVWADSHGYRRGLTIDRVDVDGSYCPENCRFATPKEQANNRRNTAYITYNGETKPLAIWCDELGVRLSPVRKRLQYGWSIERAFETPIRHYNQIDQM